MATESYHLNVAEDEDKWITVKSGPSGSSASHVKIDENGKVIAGMGGKFNGKNISDAHKPESSKEKKAKSSITSNEKSSLTSYSGDRFLDVNTRLREGEKPDAEISRIDSAIDKSSMTAKTLYRGMSRDAAKKIFKNGNISAGDIVSDKAFSSTSSEKKIAKMNSIGGVMLQIESPEGAKGIDMSEFSSNKHESEFLLPRNAKMQVVGTVPPKNSGDPVIVKVKYLSGPEVANDSFNQDKLAFDQQSVRSFDRDGKLHVARTPVTMAAVNNYYGREIPDYESLGLEGDNIYRMFRCPDELSKAVPTFNAAPLLDKHTAVLASNPPKDDIIGATGGDAEFDGQYLYNSLVAWDSKTIAGIESGQQREISSSYRYRADMTAGMYNGEEYDGVMRDIVCNHVAIVPNGRAGPTVFVYDSKPKGIDIMSKVNKLWAFLKPQLASDSDPEKVKEELKNIVEDDDEDDKDDKDKKPKTADDEQTDADKDNESEAERLTREKRELKDREEREEKDREKDKEEMAKDSRLAMDSLKAQMRGEFKSLREAEHLCEPIIGRVACDSAEEVYRMALKHSGIKGVDQLHSSALRPMVEMLKGNKMAQDSAPVIDGSSRERVNSFFKGE